ncbi:MAG: hypothetical protein LKF87_00080 [Clostridium tyrobutyricum]|jgi:hypothetical protein|uniref:hypothetical protein n=1 Tax=Clostridium tyrobutyricum TaxID=1519 RepID=UPI0002F962F0|nr:hypothetical protein [Clostridium tyrobutyricum]MBV4416594.1 hypothetical protein [Clostridium tyrobutyricum]MBV4422661.1 hypothetical protein [Clostridium tyrobutyricum]MBV4431052.1 hypothetical protein [Clostridium tyrobutyricum]MBV4436214.1 hypothetical protein [Clostridium tyrobutyricum]MBV4439969.1 hypothetical protein [Clostridium tyrobutyricum]
MDIIKVNIYGEKNKEIIGGCCSNKDTGCNSCSSKSGCSNCNTETRTIIDAYRSLNDFLNLTDVCGKVNVNFIELDDNRFETDEKDRVLDVIDRGFDAPITVIDGIIRYYGGISNKLVYKDVKELLT